MDDKSKVFNIKNFIKQENGRLTSLTMPRDLSLGGSRPKKVYAPNLNVVRNKKQPVVNVQRASKSERNKRDSLGRQKNNQNNGKFIQQASVFSEGAGEIKRPVYSNHTSIRETEDRAMPKPKVNSNTNSWNVDIKNEAGVVRDLIGSDDSSSEDECDYRPITLPLGATKNGYIKVKKKDGGLNCKAEHRTNGINKRVLNGSYYPQTISSFNNSKCYDETKSPISLIKFPDSLPGKGFDDNDKVVDYTLHKMIEGKIGKILVRKSGRIDVVIGKTKYTLDNVETAQYNEEIMCAPGEVDIKLNPQLISLGAVREKFIISPKWSNMLPKQD